MSGSAKSSGLTVQCSGLPTAAAELKRMPAALCATGTTVVPRTKIVEAGRHPAVLMGHGADTASQGPYSSGHLSGIIVT
jgi:hypothetical protein